MKVGDKLIRLVQLTVLLAVPLDAFAMSPGRLNSGALHNRAILRGRAKATFPLRAAEALPSALGSPEATNTVQTVTGGAGGEQVGYETLFGWTLWLQDDRYICLSRLVGNVLKSTACYRYTTTVVVVLSIALTPGAYDNLSTNCCMVLVGWWAMRHRFVYERVLSSKDKRHDIFISPEGVSNSRRVQSSVA